MTINLIAGTRIRFTYTNWKGRKGVRKCIVESFGLENHPHHPQTQWFIHGLDLDKNARRSYAVKDIDADTVEYL
jgi:hypothetical protein